MIHRKTGQQDEPDPKNSNDSVEGADLGKNHSLMLTTTGVEAHAEPANCSDWRTHTIGPN
jgi:hypothetical protein